MAKCCFHFKEHIPQKWWTVLPWTKYTATQIHRCCYCSVEVEVKETDYLISGHGDHAPIYQIFKAPTRTCSVNTEDNKKEPSFDRF